MAVFDDDEVIELFLEESREHLNGIEHGLLAIETEGENVSEEIINDVFRAIHSIKGGAGFLGFNNVKELSHDMENLLNLLRSKEILPSPDVITPLLSAADLLKNMINDARSSEEMDITEHITSLRTIITASLTDNNKQSLDNKIRILQSGGKEIFQISEFDLEQFHKAGKHIYLVEYDLIKDIQNKGKTPMEVISDLQKTGVFIDSKVDVDAVGNIDANIETMSIPFFILFATVLDTEVIGTMVEIDPSRIQKLSESDMNESVESPSDTNKVKKTVVVTENKQEEKPAETEEVLPQEPHVEEGIASTDSCTDKKPDNSTLKQQKQSMSDNLSDNTLRVNIKILNTLMTLAGELVLARNQLVQTVSSWDKASVENTSQRIDLITAELQEAIMSTRMQPIGNVFNKFRRVVRDMSMSLGKEVNLIIEGEDVELDKTIIEAIGDPLTHLVRNAVDHGLERKKDRVKNGKKPVGVIKLKAFHEAGQVIIEIEDDGRGINTDSIKKKALENGLYNKTQLDNMMEKEIINLIFYPGFSMAEKITDISGRGVGMDVVRTNLSKLGGIIDINTIVGLGSKFRIKLPLTLAIIPSLLVSVENERYAIPQVNLVELVRVPASQVKNKIEKIGSSLVIRLRGDLLPLIRFRDIAKITSDTYIDPATGDECSNRRENLVDRRNNLSKEMSEPLQQEQEADKSLSLHKGKNQQKRKGKDRRYRANSAINIVVVAAGDFHYGIIVDNLLDSEEIVVKPLGRHLQGCREYAGATILGDGHVALILDVVGISKNMELESNAREVEKESVMRTVDKNKTAENAQSLLVIENASAEYFAIPLGLISRIERITKDDIETLGGRRVVKYRGGSLLLFSIEEAVDVKPRTDMDNPYIVVFPVAGREVGILVSHVVDIVDAAVEIDEVTFIQPGIVGSVRIMDKIILLLDLYNIIARLMPEWVNEIKNKTSQDDNPTILIVEDSDFFRNQIKGFIEDAGFNVLSACDGLEGLELLDQHVEDIDIILTDIEMPNMDGLTMTKKIRSDTRFELIPIIAITSVAGDVATSKGREAGITEYMIKLDRENILEVVKRELTAASELAKIKFDSHSDTAA